MIDFIKLYWQDKARFEVFVCDPSNFKEVNAVLGLHSGHVNYPYCTDLNGLDVRVTEKHGYVKNSLHKAYNDLAEGIQHNYNDFRYSDLCQSIDYLCSNLPNVENTKLTQLEFGLNINLSVPASQIIINNILMHSLKGPNHNRQFNGLGELKQFDHHNYLIKTYDKAKQYRLNQNILRFEVRFVKAIELEKVGIFNITDLKYKSNLRKLFLILRKRFDEMSIVDSFCESSIEPADLEKLVRYNNPHYWNQTIRSMSSQTKMRYRRNYLRILEKYDLLKN